METAAYYFSRQVKEKGYAVVVVAEGAGEEILGETGETDATGWVTNARRTLTEILDRARLRETLNCVEKRGV